MQEVYCHRQRVIQEAYRSFRYQAKKRLLKSATSFPLNNKYLLTATHAVAAIQTFVTGAASYGDMPAYIAGRRIALHAFGCCICSIQPGFSTHACSCFMQFMRLLRWHCIRTFDTTHYLMKVCQ